MLIAERVLDEAVAATPVTGPRARGRIRVDGKQFARAGARFHFRGVTYGTFKPRRDGARFPEPEQARRDFEAIRAAGFTVVRTYTEPPADVLGLAAEFGLYLLVGVFYPDWRYLVGASRSARNQVTAAARREVRAAARRLAGQEHVLGLCLGNEVPADVLRWVGTETVAQAIRELVAIVKDEDPERLVTYANYPTAEYLPLEDLDFMTFNVFLERRGDFRRYLTRLHHLAGHRPLVLGEMGLNAGSGPDGESRQAEVIDWQLRTALERGVAGTCVFSWTDDWWVGQAAVEGWHFGLTRQDRSPRAALETAQRWNQLTVRDLDFPWPSMSVVVCAYNAARTLDECLRHTCALDYAGLEIIVVDDGSTDGTAEIVRRYRRARLVSIAHAGLAVARNEGFKAAGGDLIVYLDADAYPTPEWPHYLALGMDAPTVGGVGGPNVPPVDDPTGAQEVAHAPGGPVHVLLSDDRAEHVPGCNMAFWRLVLEEVGGFDPVYTSAGDDVDVCWKVLDRGWEIGFHPAALVWHHRRPGMGAYLRQQWGYGVSEAKVEARHPDRFTGLGTARWRGRIYNSLTPRLARQRVYRGLYGAAAYQSVYGGGGHALDLAHQAGVPLAAVLLLTAPVALIWHALGLLAVAGAFWIALLATLDWVRTQPPRGAGRIGGWAFRSRVAALHLLQPLARIAGRLLHAPAALRDLPPGRGLPEPVRRVGRGVLLLPADRSRAELATEVITLLRHAGLRVILATGWEDHDARIIGSLLVAGDVVTSAHPTGSVQIKVRKGLRGRQAVTAVSVTGLLAVVAPPVAAFVAVLLLFDTLRGLWRTGPLFRRVIGGARPVPRPRPLAPVGGEAPPRRLQERPVVPAPGLGGDGES